MSGMAIEMVGLAKAFPVRRTILETLRRPRTVSTVQALEGFTCTIREGEFFGLLGENGAGKTTLFRMLATLVAPDQGMARILGVDLVREADRVRSLVSPVFTSDRSLYWRLTARQNLALFAALHRLPRREFEGRCSEVLRIVGLDATGARLAGTFSAGMKQRLLLARALLPRPRVLLLDEPTRSLDPVAARAFRQFLKSDIGHGQGCTVLLATHDPDEVRDLCDRIGVLHRGRLIGIGTPEALAQDLGYHRYRLVTTMPAHPAIEALIAGGIRLGPATPIVDDWAARELELTAGEPMAAQVLQALLAAGVPVSRFERIELPLADLLERVVQTRKESPSA